MGETWDQALCAAGQEDGVGLHLRRHLSGRRQRRRARPALCNSEAMAMHLEEISIAVAPGAYAILILDQAGWQVSTKLPVPDNLATAAEIARAQSGGEHLAIHARQLDLKPRLQIFSTIAVSPGTSSSTWPRKIMSIVHRYARLGLSGLPHLPSGPAGVRIAGALDAARSFNTCRNRSASAESAIMSISGAAVSWS